MGIKKMGEAVTIRPPQNPYNYMEHKLILDTIEPQDHLVGNASDDWVCLVNDKRDWIQYVDNLERQYNGYFDTYHCCNFQYCKAIASIFNYQLANVENRYITDEDIQWLYNKGYIVSGRVNFSEWYSGLTSGTKADYGNSGRVVATAGREWGLIPEAMLPFTNDTKKKDFFNKSKILTKEMTDLGKEFAERFDLRFKFLNPNIKEQYDKWIKFSPLASFIATSCPWENNVQQKCFNTTNHAIIDLGDKDEDENRLGDTYYRKAKDGKYRLERRVSTDFIYYNLAYVYMVRSKNLETKDKDMKFIKEGKHRFVRINSGKKIMIVDVSTLDALEGKNEEEGTLVYIKRVID